MKQIGVKYFSLIQFIDRYIYISCIRKHINESLALREPGSGLQLLKYSKDTL